MDIDTSKVTRVELINHHSEAPIPGRCYVWWMRETVGVKIEYSIQDNGRTLKIFLSDNPPPSNVGEGEI
jgi:hypothetical protein